MPRLRILNVVSECVPFAKTGGLADVAGALPMAIAARGHDVRVVMPRYRITKKFPAEKLPWAIGVPVGHGEAWGAAYETKLGESGARMYLLEHDELFDRAGHLQRFERRLSRQPGALHVLVPWRITPRQRAQVGSSNKRASTFSPAR